MVNNINRTFLGFMYSRHRSFDRPSQHSTKYALGTMEASPVQNRPVSSNIYAACASQTPSTQPHSAPPSLPPPSGRVPRVVNPLPAAPRCVIDISYFEFLLRSHPNQGHVQYVLDGLRAGFDIVVILSSVFKPIQRHIPRCKRTPQKKYVHLKTQWNLNS